MHKLSFILLIFSFISCNKLSNNIDGHWHIYKTNWAEDIKIVDPANNSSIPTNFEIQTLDINDKKGESNRYSLFYLRSKIEKEKSSNRIVLKTDPFNTTTLNYRLKNDSIYLFDTTNKEKYIGLRVSRENCNHTDHYFERDRFYFNIPFLPDSLELKSINLDWENSNILILQQKRHHYPYFALNYDGAYGELDQVTEWYNSYVSKTYNKVKVYANNKYSAVEIKRVLIKLDEIPCDSIYFAVRKNSDNKKDLQLAWISSKELVKHITDSEKIRLLNMDNTKFYGKASENWIYNLITTANNAYSK